jgi:hypothetical protein
VAALANKRVVMRTFAAVVAVFLVTLGAAPALAADSAALHRLAFVQPKYPDPATLTPAETAIIGIARAEYDRIRAHFAADTALTTADVNPATLDRMQLRALCDSVHVTGVIFPFFDSDKDGSTLTIRAGTLIEDCNGVIYYASITVAGPASVPNLTMRMYESASTNLLNTTLKMFDDYRDAHRETWNAFTESGIPDDVAAKLTLAMIRVVGGQDRISYLNPIGAGVKAGLKEGDIIVSIDGVRPGGALTWEVSNALDHARVAEVKRANATVTITLR